MEKLTFALLAAGLLGAAVTNADTTIVGGRPASIANMPHQVSLKRDAEPYCGGALISQDWVLTAAHCLAPGWPYTIVVGTDQRNSGGVGIAPDSIFVHPQYNASTNENDIALIYLSGPAPGHLAPLELVAGANAGELATVSGFGRIAENANSSDTLQMVTLPIVSNQICESANNVARAAAGLPSRAVTNSMFCAGARQQSGCFGDSGSAAITTSAGILYSLGVVSHGAGGCARPNTYTVFTRTDSFIPWINNTIRQKIPAPRLVKSINDSSGKVTVSIFTTLSLRSQNHFRDFNVSVPDDYVVIGGGVAGTNAGNGNLITASYPNRQLTAWKVSTKDHLVPQPIKLEAYAVGLKIAGLTRSQLLNYVSLSSTTSTNLAHPEAKAAVKTNQILIGGGINVRWWGMGNLATASYPFDTTTWAGESKDHKESSPASITTFAIGIDKNIPGVGAIEVNVSQRSSGTTNRPTVISPLEPGFALSGCGAKVQWAGAGNLLWKIIPLFGASNGCDVASKDHVISSPASINAYTIGIKVIP